MLSIIIPSYNEPYLVNTLNSILDNATGKVEIFINVDDGKPVEFTRRDARIVFNYPTRSLGMRAGINWGLTKARGKYLMKVDAHCVFDKGFDQIITSQMEDNWLVIPRRYALWADGWKRVDGSIAKDYHYLSYPVQTDNYGIAMFPGEWRDRRIQRKNIAIDDTMTFQGSCWIAAKKYFLKRVEYLNDKKYGSFGGEQLEIGLKYWLSGGSIKVNKNTWYAHLFKNSRYYREVGGLDLLKHKSDLKMNGGWKELTKHWLENREPNIIHPFSWLVEKFWPVPTWPEDRKAWTYSSLSGI